MRGIIILLAVGLGAVTAASSKQQRIVGGSVTTIDQYPYSAVLLFRQIFSGAFIQSCGSTILTSTAVLTAAHCFSSQQSPSDFRVRVGSTWASSGGVVHQASSIIIHPNYNAFILDNDIAIVRTTTNFVYNAAVQQADIAGSTYNVPDNQPVWAIGWGVTEFNAPSEQLRHVQIWTVNQQVCVTRYAASNRVVSDNMLCSGWLDVGGRDQCSQDSGSPLIYIEPTGRHVIFGLSSWGSACGDPYLPGVNARVSRYTAWIQANAV